MLLFTFLATPGAEWLMAFRDGHLDTGALLSRISGEKFRQHIHFLPVRRFTTYKVFASSTTSRSHSYIYSQFTCGFVFTIGGHARSRNYSDICKC